MSIPAMFKNAHEIGRGSFGIVYKAENTRDRRICALKRLNVCGPDETTSIQTAQKEIETLGKLQGHNGIVQLLSSVRYQGSIWVEMEFCEEGNLNDFYWKNPDDVDAPLKFQLTVEMASAVHYLHSSGVAHRDLKPDNILISYGADGKPHSKIGDFGLAKIIANGQFNNNINQFYMSSTQGTKFFWAPEIFGSASHYTVAVDVYSLGLIFAALIQESGNRKSGRLRLAVRCPGYSGEMPLGAMQRCNDKYTFNFPEGYPASLRMKMLLSSMLAADYHCRPTAENVVGYLQGMDANDISNVPRDQQGSQDIWVTVGVVVAFVIMVVLAIFGISR